MIDIGWIFLGAMTLAPIVGFTLDSVKNKIVGYFKKPTEEVKHRRTFKPGVLGKYEPE